MFDAPEIIKQIPDIRQIYVINDAQSDGIDKALEDLENDIFVDTMTEEVTEHWEEFLNLTAQAGDTLSDRRTRVKAKILERLPYSYRVLARKITELCEEVYSIELNSDRTAMEVYALFDRESQLLAMLEMLESCLPLSVIYRVISQKYREVTQPYYAGVCASTNTKPAAITEGYKGANAATGTTYAGAGGTASAKPAAITEDYKDASSATGTTYTGASEMESTKPAAIMEGLTETADTITQAIAAGTLADSTYKNTITEQEE